LPPGWASKCSKSTGKTFYYHSVTKATAWSLGEIPGFEPSIIATSSPVPAPAPAPIVVSSSSINTTKSATVQAVKPNDVTLPQGWSAKVSKSTGKSFYYHAVTKATVWSVNDIPGYTAAVPVIPVVLTKVLVTPASPPVLTNALVSPVKVTPASPPVLTNALVSPVKLTADESLLLLPTGWTNRSSSSGKLFYYHAATKQTSWVRPVVV
jgi:WW domain